MLGFVYLKDFIDVNNYKPTDELAIINGNAFRLYFQIVTINDLAQCPMQNLRYLPVSGSSISVSLMNINDASIVNKVATQAFPTSDTSIWYINLSANDIVTPNGIEMNLTSGSTVTKLVGLSEIRSLPTGKAKSYC